MPIIHRMTIAAALPHSRIDETLMRGLEASKWLAMILMVLSHLGSAFNGEIHWIAFWIGRVCAPIFAFLIIARLSEKPIERGKRYLIRLLAWGIPAQVPFYLWTQTFGFHLNELVVWAFGVATIILWENNLRLVAILVSGAILVAAMYLLELSTIPVMLIAYLIYRRSPLWALIALSAGCAAVPLYMRPHELVAPAICMATPLAVVLCGLLPVRPPRLPGWFFYALYPVHIAMIFLVFGLLSPMKS